MKANVQEVLQDLYAMDPGLKSQEDRLTRLVETMAALKPTGEIDQEFRKNLKHRIINRVRAQSPRVVEVRKTSIFTVLLSFLSGWVALAGAGAVLWTQTDVLAPYLSNLGNGGTTVQRVSLPEKSAAVVGPTRSDALVGTGTETAMASGTTIGSGAIAGSGTPSTKAGQAAFSLAGNVRLSEESSTGAKAFGELGIGSEKPTSTETPENAPSMVADMAFTQAPPVPSANLVEWDAPLSPRQAKLLAEKTPAVERYVSSAPVPAYPGKTVEVFKKVSVPLPYSASSQLIGSMPNAWLNLSGLKDGKATRVDLAETIPYGVIYSFDLQNGTIGIDRNPEAWPKTPCGRKRCPPLRMESMPSNQELIGAANNFLSTIGISYSGSEAVVLDSFREYGTGELADMNYVLPETVSIRYAMILNGYPVYDEASGLPFGFTVEVDARSKKVTSVQGLSKAKYVGSAYLAEGDSAKLIDILARGGSRASELPKTAKFTDVTVSAAKTVYVRTVQEENGETVEYFYPAYAFQKGEPAPGQQPRSIFVSLVR